MYILINLLLLLYPYTQKNTGNGRLILHLHSTVGKIPLELNNKWYTNPSGEKYTVDLFKYYISNINFSGSNSFKETDSYHLVNAASSESETIIMDLPVGKYDGISFMIGVDSLHNVSGAQEGDLDPLKGMFWAWNSGYIMAKLEGHSDASPYNHKFEYHIGGFEGSDNVLQTIHLPQQFEIAPSKSSVININVDINKWWGNNMLKINKIPTIASPGHISKMISNNYAAMFSLE